MSGEERVREKLFQILLVRRIRVLMVSSSLALFVRIRPRYLNDLTCSIGSFATKKVVLESCCCVNKACRCLCCCVRCRHVLEVRCVVVRSCV